MNEKKEVKNSRLTRRHFARRLTQLLVYGGLVNFSLGGTAKAATSKETAHEDCPGGLPSVDVCAPPLDYDYCPGEMPPADECPADGNREEDECNSGLAAADICDPSVKRSDQCQNGLPKDDQCPESAPDDDYCPTGHPSSDSCPPDGGIADGDQCPGGGDENWTHVCQLQKAEMNVAKAAMVLKMIATLNKKTAVLQHFPWLHWMMIPVQMRLM